MTVIRLICLAAGLLLVAACEPGASSFGVPASGAEKAKYERHKANRQSYMYQGL